MSDPAFERVREIFLQVQEMPKDQWGQALARLCGEDVSLREEVLSLLAAVDSDLPETDILQGINQALPNALEAEGKSVPECIGNYRLQEEIGRGGMGIVFRALHQGTGREVALKLVRSTWASEEAKRRFDYEVSVLARLKDPGIAHIYDAGRYRDGDVEVPYFAMELVDGVDLATYAEKNSPSLDERLAIFVKIARAVHHAHQRGIIHRDLKPANILVDSREQPRILDFGIAKSIDADVQATQRTSFGDILGTLAYMSPEQARGEPDEIDTRSDVYSLGVIFYQLLSGRLPYPVHGKKVHDAIRMIQEEDALPLDRVGKRLSAELATIASKALEKDKRRRYSSAADFAEDVARYLRREPILARPASAAYQLKKFASRNRVLVLGILATTFALVAGTVVSVVFAKSARARAEQAEQAEQSTKKALDRAVQAEQRALSLSGLARLQELEARAEDLWPRHPRLIPDFEAWQGSAKTILDEIPLYETYLEQIRDEGEIVDGSFRFEDSRKAWLHQKMSELVEKIHAFAEPESGLAAAVEARLDRAMEIEARTLDDFEEAWDDAIFEISESEWYEGMEIAPQIGLVPIGMDPQSELYEFGVWETGDIPERDEDGEFEMTGDTAVILVLLPGGEVTIGASRNPRAEHHDPLAGPDESPVHEFKLDPFFISKFEFTQGQWSRTMDGVNPSSSQNGQVLWHHPVESVSWNDVSEAYRRVGLSHPTETQWEYAARAGTTTPWWTGTDRQELASTANVADEYARTHGGHPSWTYEAWDDGYSSHAPVGSFRANPFGLYDIYGNVWELCMDTYGGYAEAQPRDGDGLREDPRANQRAVRGGSFTLPGSFARSSDRDSATVDFRIIDIGTRPVRRLDDE